MQMRKSILKPDIVLPNQTQHRPDKYLVRLTNLNDCDNKDIFMLLSGVQDLLFIHVSESCTFAILAFHHEESALEFIRQYNKLPFHSVILEASLLTPTV